MNNKDELLRSYQEVFDDYLKKDNITKFDLQNSLKIFEKESLKEGKPIPKDLEVVGLISGISFPNDFVENIIKVQSEISNILGNTLHYMVKPNNLAVEYCVLKWPEQKYEENCIKEVITMLKDMNIKKFKLFVYGFQFHTDGCMLLQATSEELQINRIRKFLRDNIDSLPEKQSNWSHIPLGRFLGPFNKEDKKLIDQKIKNFNQNFKPFYTEINTIYLVHEHKWYMENIEKIFTKYLL